MPIRAFEATTDNQSAPLNAAARVIPYLANFAEEATVGDVPVGGTVENLQQQHVATRRIVTSGQS